MHTQSRKRFGTDSPLVKSDDLRLPLVGDLRPKTSNLQKTSLTKAEVYYCPAVQCRTAFYGEDPSMWKSSNPILNNNDTFSQVYGKDMFATKADVMTVEGVVNKTALLVGIAITAGFGGYLLFQNNPAVIWIAGLASLVICLGMGMVMRGNPARARVIGPIYAIVEGCFLGAVTAIADSILKNRGITVAGGVGVQAFIVTAACMLSMLGMYKFGIIKPTATLKAVVGVATGGIMLAYLVSFILSFIWQPLPLISFSSAVQDTGAIGFVGLGINLLILGIASLWLVIDFGEIEEHVDAGAPKVMEWYFGFALLVTLAWIYYEAVKLVVRVATLLGSRD
jgi:uncharacterized YccA/Bax inhibitor family protein